MSTKPFRRCCRGITAAGLLILALLLPGLANAHSFTLAVRSESGEPTLALASAIRALRLAAAERDGHEGETSDGHLGGLDLFIRPLPRDAAHGIAGLKHAPPGPPDILLVLGAGPVDPGDTGPVAIDPGALPPGWQDVTDPASFAARYQAATGLPADRAAAEAYNAARRIDRAVRAQGGTGDRSAMVRSLLSTAEGIEW